MKHIATLSKLTIAILFTSLFTITNLFAAQECKTSDKTKYDNQLTEELNKLCKNSRDHRWDQKATQEAVTLIIACANPGYVLNKACIYDNIPLIEACLKYGASVHEAGPTSGATAISYARSFEAIQLLLNAGADAHVQATNFISFGSFKAVDRIRTEYAQALHFACGLHYSLKAIELLCNNTQANPLSLDGANRTPLHYLCLTAKKKKKTIFLKKLLHSSGGR